MADDDKFYFELINVETEAVIQGREYMTKDQANKRNRSLEKMGSKKHQWRRVDGGSNMYHYHQPNELEDR